MSGEVDDAVRESGTAASKLLQALTALAQLHQVAVEAAVRAADRAEQGRERQARQLEFRERAQDRKQQRRLEALRLRRELQKHQDVLEVPQLRQQLAQLERRAGEARMAAYDAVRRLEPAAHAEWTGYLSDAGIDTSPYEEAAVGKDDPAGTEPSTSRSSERTETSNEFEGQVLVEPEQYQNVSVSNENTGAATYLDVDVTEDLVTAAFPDGGELTPDALSGARFDEPSEVAEDLSETAAYVDPTLNEWCGDD
ncbi:hypothetical protein [Nocardia arthritidis]|uniref:Uncharacterized protein n=1 Tax=Nocardia arthritidis TaxID=228602 RepID=A0A6G9YKV2_9NOCA|nr:hypothetical protein [Nocardia arthritidis]QIS13935.1 hypothetical protein F5544_30460 [Nocardia arthritidis]